MNRLFFYTRIAEGWSSEAWKLGYLDLRQGALPLANAQEPFTTLPTTLHEPTDVVDVIVSPNGEHLLHRTRARNGAPDSYEAIVLRDTQSLEAIDGLIEDGAYHTASVLCDRAYAITTYHLGDIGEGHSELRINALVSGGGGHSSTFKAYTASLAFNRSGTQLAVPTGENKPSNVRLYSLHEKGEPTYVALPVYVEWDSQLLCFSADETRLVCLDSALSYDGYLEVFITDLVHPFKSVVHRYHMDYGFAGVSAARVGDQLLFAVASEATEYGLYRLDLTDYSLHMLPLYTKDMNIYSLAYEAASERLWLTHNPLPDGLGGTTCLSYCNLEIFAEVSNPWIGVVAHPVRGVMHPNLKIAVAQNGMGQIKGSVFGKDGQRVSRTVQAFSRVDGRLLAQTQSSPIDGRYRLFVPDVNEPCDVTFRALEGEGLNDLIVARVTPQPIRDVAPFNAWPNTGDFDKLEAEEVEEIKYKPPPVAAPTPPARVGPPPKPPKNPPPATEWTRPPMPAPIPSMRVYAKENDIGNYNGGTGAKYVDQPGWVYFMWYWGWGYWQIQIFYKWD